MKYTRYISTVFKTNGVPNLNERGFATLMNIVHLEGAVDGLRKMQDKEKNDIAKYKYGIWIEDYQSKLDELTWQLEPKKMMGQLANNTD
ncbi:MAG: hypothetical protein QNK23_07540 [Crocinitomicaceae bacterium]|nr:hypothetical protein [Crocinitomicaceae bacterium]